MNDYRAIRRDLFDLLTEYVEDLPVPFYKAEKAVKIQEIFRSAVPVTIAPPEEKK